MLEILVTLLFVWLFWQGIKLAFRIAWGAVKIIAVILIVVAIELMSPGLKITFDSKGGTDVATQTQMYGERLETPEPPTREGYRFTGWYIDISCDELWDVTSDTIETDMTLYAGWEKLE